MKKIFTKNWWVGLISVPIIAGGIAFACAGGWGEEYGTSNFTPEVFADSAYRPFFYSEMFYYNIGHDINHDKRFNETVVNEWNNWFENKVPAADLEYLLMHESAGAIDSASAYLTGKMKQLPPSMRTLNLFTNRNPKTNDFITYLSLAKKCEAFALNNFESEWDYQANNKPAPFNAGKLNPVLLQGFNNSKDPFLKQRYWFQLIRSHYFNTTPQNAIELFENNKNSFQKNKLYYRTMAYAAGAYYKQKKYSKANYYFSRVYDGCNELKTVAHYSFHPQEEADWKATLALCQNKDEQATLWQMLGVFYEDEKRAINEIHQLDPKSEKLDLLLVRAINKEEQKFGSWNSHLLKGRVNYLTEQVDQQLQLLVSRIAATPNTGKPYMWHMAAGYLSMLKNDFTKAQSQYALAEKTLPASNRHRAQLRLLRFMNKLAAANRIDGKLENELLGDIEWLTNLPAQDFPEFRHAQAHHWMRANIAFRYRKQKDFLKAEFFYPDNVFYTSNNNVEAMKAFFDKPNKSAYEALCVKLYSLKKSDLLEFQAIKLTFEDKLAEAVSKMEAGTNANRELLGNPFNGRINDCHDCDHQAPQKIKYTKLSLLKKMKEMQDKVAAGEDVYNNAMLLANAFYNITHYGNARYFYEGAITGTGQYSPFTIDSVFQDLLTDMKQASKYYNKALQAAATNEQKAKCHYMIAKCERNQWYNQTVYNDKENWYSGENPKGDFKGWAAFKALQQYSNTQYYKEVIKECGYFRTYIGR